MERMRNKNKRGAGGKGKDGAGAADTGKGRTNSSAKVFSNLQKIVASDYKKRDDKREARETGKKYAGGGQFGSKPTHGQASKRFKL